MDEGERQVTGDLCVTPAGVGGEVFFGEDARRARFGEQGAQDFERRAAAKDEVGVAGAQVVVKGMQTCVEKVPPARGGGGKFRVEDKERDDGARCQSRVKRRVVAQAQVTANPPDAGRAGRCVLGHGLLSR
jgi:hypothetical protein